jgi:ppGpp synthetase/RelA/SpoT-type nucleotidyltranferase
MRGLICEIQVKTLLDDGWATKTHDLTYKPRQGVSVNPELKAQVNILGDSIQLIERQSDIVRKLIEHQWSRDRQRRAAAQQQLLFALIQEQREDVDPDVRTWTGAIVSDFQNDREII